MHTYVKQSRLFLLFCSIETKQRERDREKREELFYQSFLLSFDAMNSEHCCHFFEQNQSNVSDFDQLSLTTSDHDSGLSSSSLLLPPALPKISSLSHSDISIRFYCQSCQIICCGNCLSHQTHQLLPIDQAVKFDKVNYSKCLYEFN